MGRVLISYRREDTEGEAGRLHDDLSSQLKYHIVDIDVDAFEPGEDFIAGINALLAQSDVLLALIGPGWFGEKDVNGTSRVHSPSDFVRLEIALAFERGIRVVPVLVRGAVMPHPEDLPNDLKPIVRLNGFQLTHTRWKADISELSAWLNRYLVINSGNETSTNRAGNIESKLHNTIVVLTNEIEQLKAELAEARSESAELRKTQKVLKGAEGRSSNLNTLSGRLKLTYDLFDGSEKESKEIPLRLLFLGDFTLRHDIIPLEQRKLYGVTADNFSNVMAAHSLELTFEITNRLPGRPDEALQIQLHFASLDDFTPDSIVTAVPELNDLLKLRKAISTIDRLIPDNQAFQKALREAVAYTNDSQRGSVSKEASFTPPHKGKNQSPADVADDYSRILETVMSTTTFHAEDKAYSYLKSGLEHFLKEYKNYTSNRDSINKAWFQNLITKIDSLLSSHVNEILHYPGFQRMESAWRALWYTVLHADHMSNIEFCLLSASKDELLHDEKCHAEDHSQSGLYHQLYNTTFRSFGGEPFTAVISNDSFGPDPSDIHLLQYVGNVSADAHTPFIAAASPELVGLEDFSRLQNFKNVIELLESPGWHEWRALRENENSCYIGLTLPRFMLRRPYGRLNDVVQSFSFEENVEDSIRHYAWGHAAFAFVTLLVESFTKHGMCTNVVGARDGLIEGLPIIVQENMGVVETRPQIEVQITDRLEFELASAGFIPLTARRGNAGEAAFFSASSVRQARQYEGPNAQEATLSEKLNCQLPYLFFVTRFMHYLKIIHREAREAWNRPSVIEAELTRWIYKYISDQENPPREVSNPRPLRAAKVSVTESEEHPEFYSITLTLMPHWKYMGSTFNLSITGKLDKYQRF